MPNPASDRPRPKVDAGLVIVFVVAVAAGALCYMLKGPGVFWSVLGDDLWLLLAIAPKVLAGVLLAGLLTVLLPREQVARWMGSRSGFKGLALASLAGALLPGGPMMTFPLAVALGAAGADIGTATAFIAGWGLLNVSRTLVWEFSFFDGDFVLLRYGLSLLLPILLGWLARQLFGRAKALAEGQGGAE
ncbi:permease [Pelagibius sp.]|uniref:permease n=1 Tax=Pelagibius sp. TaxID=1931238 RepID=UPI003BAF4D8A